MAINLTLGLIESIFNIFIGVEIFLNIFRHLVASVLPIKDRCCLVYIPPLSAQNPPRTITSLHDKISPRTMISSVNYLFSQKLTINLIKYCYKVVFPMYEIISSLKQSFTEPIPQQYLQGLLFRKSWHDYIHLKQIKPQRHAAKPKT